MSIILNCILASQFVIMSDRANFWDTDFISPQTEIIADNTLQESSIDFELFNDKKILMLVHGFNNSFVDAMTTYRQINNHMSTFTDTSGAPLYEMIVGYLWPGYDEGADYFYAENNVHALTSRMRMNLEMIRQKATQVDVLAHSMGNRLILDALDYVNTTMNVLPIKNFYSLAAAVDDDSIENMQRYFSSTHQCRDMFVFHSDRDDVLKFLYPIAELHQALGLEGAENYKKAPNNLQFIDCTSIVDAHSAYFTAEPVFDFILNQQRMQTPPVQRTPLLKFLANGALETVSE